METLQGNIFFVILVYTSKILFLYNKTFVAFVCVAVKIASYVCFN